MTRRPADHPPRADKHSRPSRDRGGSQRRGSTFRVGPAAKRKALPKQMGSSVRIGDLRAAARMIARIEEPAKLGIGQKRQLLAQICRVIGEQIRAASGTAGPAPTSDHAAVPAAAVALAAEESATTSVNVRLSPRMQQTLDRLLKGDSEKQVAMHLGVSPHTVHVYVKAIYRKLGVASRGELLARFVRA